MLLRGGRRWKGKGKEKGRGGKVYIKCISILLSTTLYIPILACTDQNPSYPDRAICKPLFVIILQNCITNSFIFAPVHPPPTPSLLPSSLHNFNFLEPGNNAKDAKPGEHSRRIICLSYTSTLHFLNHCRLFQ